MNLKFQSGQSIMVEVAAGPPGFKEKVGIYSKMQFVFILCDVLQQLSQLLCINA